MAVKIFAAEQFTGRRLTLEPGKYPTIPAHLGDNQIESIQVEPGFYTVVYMNFGFRGDSFTLFEGEYPTLNGKNNRISSMEIFEHDPTIFPTVSFFTDFDFKGFQQNLAATGQTTTFDAPFSSHDVMSSVKVPEGVTLTIFEHSNQGGKSLSLYPGEYDDLRIFGFDNKASSLQIQQNNMEVVNIEYVSLETRDGEPILIDSTAQNGTNLQQQANLTLEAAYEETFTRSFSNSTLFGLEISRTTSVGVNRGPLSASVEQTLTATFENTFTFGQEESKTRTVTVAKELNVKIPPEHSVRAVMTLTPQRAKIEAIYTLRLKGTDRTTKQNVTIETKSASVGTVVIEPFVPLAK